MINGVEIGTIIVMFYFLARGFNTAEQIVNFCQAQPMFRQTIQAKYLTATTTRRSYYHLTGTEVEILAPKQLVRSRSVKPLEGKT